MRLTCYQFANWARESNGVWSDLPQPFWLDARGPVLHHIFLGTDSFLNLFIRCRGRKERKEGRRKEGRDGGKGQWHHLPSVWTLFGPNKDPCGGLSWSPETSAAGSSCSDNPCTQRRCPGHLGLCLGLTWTSKACCILCLTSDWDVASAHLIDHPFLDTWKTTPQFPLKLGCNHVTEFWPTICRQEECTAL